MDEEILHGDVSLVIHSFTRIPRCDSLTHKHLWVTAKLKHFQADGSWENFIEYNGLLTQYRQDDKIFMHRIDLKTAQKDKNLLSSFFHLQFWLSDNNGDCSEP
jgi:hypothetical protein